MNFQNKNHLKENNKIIYRKHNKNTRYRKTECWLYKEAGKINERICRTFQGTTTKVNNYFNRKYKNLDELKSNVVYKYTSLNDISNILDIFQDH